MGEMGRSGGKWGKEGGTGGNGGKRLVEWGKMGKKVETRRKLGKHTGKNAPLFPNFPPAIARYTQPLCPTSTENHHFPPFLGMVYHHVPAQFSKNDTFSPTHHPFSHSFPYFGLYPGKVPVVGIPGPWWTNGSWRVSDVSTPKTTGGGKSRGAEKTPACYWPLPTSPLSFPGGGGGGTMRIGRIPGTQVHGL